MSKDHKTRRIRLKPDEVAIVFDPLGPTIVFGDQLAEQTAEKPVKEGDQYPFHVACAVSIWTLLEKEPEILEALMKRHFIMERAYAPPKRDLH